MYITCARKVCQVHTSTAIGLRISCQKRFISELKCKIKFFIANALPLSNLELRPSRAFKFKWATINFLLTICLHILLRTYLLPRLYYKGNAMFIFFKHICFQYLRRYQQFFNITNFTNLLYLKTLCIGFPSHS